MAQARGRTNDVLVSPGMCNNEPLPLIDVTRIARSVRSGSGNIACWMGSGYQPFRDQVQFDLTVWGPTALQGLISSSAGPGFQDLSALLTMALQNHWLRDSLATFAAYSMLTMSKGDRSWERVATTAYQNALPAVRSHIRASGRNAHSLETLVAITFLGLSESLGTGDVVYAITHFSTAAAICKMVPFTSMKTVAERQLYRIVVECWLYNLATLSLLHDDCESLSLCIDWHVLDVCFSSSLDKTDWALSTSPFTGGSHEIYKLMAQITWLARRKATLLVRQAQTREWSARLDDIQSRVGQLFLVLPRPIAHLYRAKALLHVYALRIFAAKVADHKITSSPPMIQNHVRDARETFQSQSVRESRNPALAWPLIIFLCAAQEQSTFDFFVRTINSIHENFDTGHARRMHAVMDTIRQQWAEGRDGLDLLLRKRGMLTADE